MDTNGSGHGALAGFLAAQGVDTLICGGIGGGAQAALAEANIRLLGGVQVVRMPRLRRSCPVLLCIIRMSSAATMGIMGKGMTVLRTVTMPAAVTATAKPCPDRKNAVVCAACRFSASLAHVELAVWVSRLCWDWMSMRSSG